MFFFAAKMDKFFDVLALIEVFSYELCREALVKNQAVIVLIETIHIYAHKAEEFRVDQLLVAVLDSDHAWKDLAKIHIHFFRFVEK